jgi:hypothetical protein
VLFKYSCVLSFGAGHHNNYSQLSIDGAILQEVYGRLLVCLHDKVLNGEAVRLHVTKVKEAKKARSKNNKAARKAKRLEELMGQTAEDGEEDVWTSMPDSERTSADGALSTDLPATRARSTKPNSGFRGLLQRAMEKC